MKLFKSLLIAPAVLGLITPISAKANDLNIAGISDYSSSREVKSMSEFYSKKQPLTSSLGDGLSTRMNNLEAGSFTETTTASFSSNFAVGAVDGLGITTTDKDNGKEAVAASYDFIIDLNTSFTGEDSLDISLVAGNSAASQLSEFDLKSTTDALNVDGLSYSFPIGDKINAFIGAQGTDGSNAFTVACTYGGPSNTLDDCGNVNSGFESMDGSSFGGSYAVNDEVSIAIGYAGNGVDDSKGLMTKEGLDAWGTNVAYTTDSFGASLTYSVIETSSAYADTHIALNGYLSPEGFPSISAGYEFTDIGGAAQNVDEKTSFFVGLQMDEIGPGSAGIAIGTQGSITEGSEEALMYEAFYSYPVNDGMTITPLIYSKEKTSSTDEDETGIMVKTSFTF